MPLYRRRFAFELLMALHDSPVADAAAKAASLAALCRAARLPAAARDLAASSGAARGVAATRCATRAGCCKLPIAPCPGQRL